MCVRVPKYLLILTRFYVQFPLELAHEYHNEEDEIFPHQSLSLLPTQANIGSSRLDSRVVEKINELVARGVTDIYQVKHGVINFVEKDLFLCGDERIPARQNKLFFPTITDLQNHIHQALLALESGTLESLPPVSCQGVFSVELDYFKRLTHSIRVDWG